MTDEFKVFEGHVDLYRMLLYQRGISSMEDVCPKCKGLGVRLYRTNTTWRGDLGTLVTVRDVCDECWGSGKHKHPWPSHRDFEEMDRYFDLESKCIEWVSADEVEKNRLKAEEDFEEFWRRWVWPDGEVTPELVKLELYDYHRIMGDASKVYDHVTNGKVSKPNTCASVVIAMADDALQESIDEAVKEEVEQIGWDRSRLEERVLKLEKMIEDWVKGDLSEVGRLVQAYAEYVEGMEGEPTDWVFLREGRGGGNEGDVSPIEPKPLENEPDHKYSPDEGTIRECP